MKRWKSFSIFLFLLLVSCGVKTSPTYKSPVKPRVSALTIKVRKGTLTLYWNYVGPYTGLFRIYRYRGRACYRCSFESFKEVSPGKEGSLFYYEDKEAKPGGRYCYKVVPFSGGGEFGVPSAVACFDFLYLPPPPAGLVAKPIGGGCLLRWKEREHVEGYNVYRWKKGQNPPRVPVNRHISRGSSYFDMGIPPGKYMYCVTSVFVKSGLFFEGPCSRPVEVEIVRFMEPPPPVGVVAVPRRDGIFISWSPGGEGLFSYVVERSEDGDHFYRITPKPITRIFYVDKEAEKGKVYYYRVRSYYRGYETGPISLPSKVIRVKFTLR